MLFAVWSAVDNDVTAGLLQRKNPRHHCLAYRRKLFTTDVTQPKKKVRPDGDSADRVGLRHEELWRNVQQHLGPSQAREYSVNGAPRHGELTADHETYLQRLSDDFVMDIQALISQRLAATQSAPRSSRLVGEVLHHAALARKMLGADGDGLDSERYSGLLRRLELGADGDGQDSERYSGLLRRLELGADGDGQDSDRYSGLLRRLESFVKDPRQSCRPFVIHGPQSSHVSAAVSTVAAALPHWLSASRNVTVLRFIGTTTDSTDVRACVASVRAEVESSYGLEVSPALQSLHCELTALRAMLEHLSLSHAHTQPLFLLLDQVDALQPHRDALEALWAVRHLPSNIYLVMSVGRQQTGVVEPLLALITDPDLTYDISCDSTWRHLSADAVDMLNPTLDTLEADLGPMIVKYFAAYVAVVDVGILDSELYDLLSTNDHVTAEHSHVSFSPGIVSILRHKLDHFLAARLVSGCAGFAWSRPEYRQAVAQRYHVTVGGADQLSDFTVTVHEHVVQLYQDVTRKSSVAGASTSLSGDSDNEGDVRTTVHWVDGPRSAVKAKVNEGDVRGGLFIGSMVLGARSRPRSTRVT